MLGPSSFVMCNKVSEIDPCYFEGTTRKLGSIQKPDVYFRLVSPLAKITGDSDKLLYIIDRKHCFVMTKKRINPFKMVYFCW
jgi:hypothetical protein